MEIQEGKGPWAPPLNGIAPLGSTLTMVISVKDPSGEFDMRVKDCEASDGQTGRALPLSDPEKCIIRPKLLGKFSKVKLDDGRATVLTYAFISAFKFPDMLNVLLRCTVEICRHGCPDHCTGLNGPGQSKGNLLSQYTQNEPVAAQSQQSYSKTRPNQIPTNFPKGPRNLRLRRSITGLSDVIGVQGAFKVVSQADLNFAMNANSTSPTPTIVLRGKMVQGDPIYGICLPRVGFRVVFFGLGFATLVSILIAAFFAYAHYTVRDYKGQNGGESLPSHPSMQMPLPYQFFPMVMLRKMW